jgi:hypothetical protein
LLVSLHGTLLGRAIQVVRIAERDQLGEKKRWKPDPSRAAY